MGKGNVGRGPDAPERNPSQHATNPKCAHGRDLLSAPMNVRFLLVRVVGERKRELIGDTVEDW